MGALLKLMVSMERSATERAISNGKLYRPLRLVPVFRFLSLQQNVPSNHALNVFLLILLFPLNFGEARDWSVSLGSLCTSLHVNARLWINSP